MDTTNGQVTGLNITDSISASLACWSRVGFDSFLASGFISSLIESANNRVVINQCQIYSEPLVLEMLKESSCTSVVTREQRFDFLNIVPIQTTEHFISFMSVFSLWCSTAGWWERNVLSWYRHDELRAVMGLLPLSPRYETEGKKLFLKKIESIGDLQNIPEGFRCITYEEYKQFPVTFSGKKKKFIVLCGETELCLFDASRDVPLKETISVSSNDIDCFLALTLCK